MRISNPFWPRPVNNKWFNDTTQEHAFDSNQRFTRDTLYDGLQAYWPANGTYNDFSGNGRGLRIASPLNDGASSFVEGKIGSSFNFRQFDLDPTQNDTLRYRDSTSIFNSTSFTFQIWINAAGIQSGMYIVSRHKDLGGVGDTTLSGWSLSMADTSIFSINHNAQIICEPDPPYNADEWTHVVLRESFVRNVSDDSIISTIQLFHNGKMYDYSDTEMIRYVNDDADLVLGGYSEAAGSTPSSGMSGMLDEVAFWNRALTNEEILSLYNNGNGRTLLR